MSEQDSGPLFEILVAIVDGPAPLGRVEVPIRPGLNALYGRNGAGKTRLLTALSGLTRSTPINSDPIDPPLQFVVRPLNEAMLVEHISASHEKRIGENHVDLELRLGPFPWRRGPYSALETVVGDALIEQWNSYPTWGRCSQDHSDHPRQVDVVNEVLHNMTWILAMGTKGWDLHLGIRFCEETPILINQRQRVIFDELRTIYKRNPEKLQRSAPGRLPRGDLTYQQTTFPQATLRITSVDAISSQFLVHSMIHMEKKTSLSKSFVGCRNTAISSISARFAKHGQWSVARAPDRAELDSLR